MIRYDENDEPNKYGVTDRMRDIFELAKANGKTGKDFTKEEREYYNICMISFRNADENGVSRDTVVQWFND